MFGGREGKLKGPFDLPSLPPNINYGELVEHVARAHTALARLDEMMKHMGNNLSHLESTFFNPESVLSSKIEGTQVTLEDVLKEEAIDGNKTASRVKNVLSK